MAVQKSSDRSLTITFRDVKIEIRDYPLGVSLILGLGFGLGVAAYVAFEYFVVGTE